MYRSDGITIANVGKRYRTPFKTKCSLCRILLASRKSSLDLYPINDEDEDDTDELRAFILLEDAEVLDYESQWAFHNAYQNVSIYIDLVSSKFPFNSKQRRANGAKQGFAVICKPHELPGKITAQVVPPYFDPAIAKGWIHFCRKHHYIKCLAQKHASVTNLHLIDCESLVVEQGHPQAPYVALSYVWGSSAACDQYSLKSTSDSTFSLPSILPPVILDAITVTKSLGFRYLWVDKFCIDQVNSDVKHQQITHMDSVYENAEVTIVAAAGFDETHGLPGVGSKSRSIQPIARIKNLAVLSTMRDVHHSIRSSKWFTRGWTFQEALLTRRRLVFTDEQAYFECSEMNCCESFAESIDELHKEYEPMLSGYPRVGMFERSSWQSSRNLRGGPAHELDIFIRYLTAVEDYTPRELRHQHDSLNAFAGVIKKFERAHHPIIQLWGIPTTIERRDLTERYFVHALCWGHVYSSWDGLLRPCRRPDFPSWSWAGWAGKVNHTIGFNFMLAESEHFEARLSHWEFFLGYAGIHVKISLESEAGEILEFGEIADSILINRFDVAFARILRLRASVFPSSSL